MIEDSGYLFAEFATNGSKPIARRRERKGCSIPLINVLSPSLRSTAAVPVMGIDPGTTQSAFVVWDGQSVLNHGILENYDMIKTVAAHEGDLAIEMVQSFGMPLGRDVFTTVVWVGRFFQRFCDQWPTKSVDLVYRGEVKKFFCGNMRAKDGNIRQALIDIVGPVGKKSSPGPTYGIAGDEWQALAVAVFSKNATPF